ncbi:ancylostoma secreted protein-like [Coccinella septempunctata]|uniref:ancylostoma secreted protein-like n=1 Tax=Coccinella septempunctata TaxID=41139 RepID=UPI001D0648B9|nr:ancylostoma secreted protein-like [Coccinella septempunctata]
MRIAFSTLNICLIFFLDGCLMNEILRPSFYPYCTTREKCQPACICEVYPNCVLLTMDETIRSSILFYHNQIRDIQCAAEPEPSGLTLLEYDMELEEISNCWAARCDDEYSECFVTSRFYETTQSVIQLVLAEGQQPSVFIWMQVMNEWLGQIRTLPAEIIQNFPGGEVGEKLHNYAQLISDRILAIGCAWSLLNNVLTLVCTYGPRGPMQGEAVYKTGYPCSLCPGGYACDYMKPFEQLCKLRIYSAALTVQEQMPRYQTPLPPPFPPFPPKTEVTEEYSTPFLEAMVVPAAPTSLPPSLPPFRFPDDSSDTTKPLDLLKPPSLPPSRFPNDPTDKDNLWPTHSRPQTTPSSLFLPPTETTTIKPLRTAPESHSVRLKHFCISSVAIGFIINILL